jgi:hypothetical protein
MRTLLRPEVQGRSGAFRRRRPSGKLAAMAGRAATPDLRVSDEERNDAAAALREHCLAGRLSVNELDERLAAAYAARTATELARLVADLPGEQLADATARSGHVRSWRRFGLPGLRAFVQQHDFEARRADVFRHALSKVVPAMLAAGYDLTERADGELLVFESAERPAWVLAACILVFPIGLLALQVRNTYRIVVAFDDAPDGGTRLTVQGTARRPVRRAFAELSD